MKKKLIKQINKLEHYITCIYMLTINLPYFFEHVGQGTNQGTY